MAVAEKDRVKEDKGAAPTPPALLLSTKRYSFIDKDRVAFLWNRPLRQRSLRARDLVGLSEEGVRVFAELLV